MNMKRIIIPLMILLICTVSCDKGRFLPSDIPVAFGNSVSETKASEIATTATMSTMGIMGYYSGSNTYSSSSVSGDTPNYMFDQLVSKSSGTWGYSPLKYWPATANNYLTFFAYSPHSTAASGITTSGNTNKGYPYIDFTVQGAPADQIDFLVSAPKTNLDIDDASSAIEFDMKHSLSKIKFASNEIYIVSITIDGIKNSGRVSYDASGNIIWSNQSGNATYSISSPLVGDGGYKNTFHFQGLTYTGESTTAGTMLLIPQTIASDIPVTVVYRKGYGALQTETQTTKIPAGTLWGIGQSYKYTIVYQDSDRLLTILLTVEEWVDNNPVTDNNIGG
jgi:hypothetical protein